MWKTKRKNISLCVAAMVLIVLFAGIPAVQAQAESSAYTDVATGLIWSYELDESVSGNAIIITGCENANGNKPSGGITIPDNIDGYAITKIGDYAFDSYYELTSIDIPSGVTEIGKYAFANCTSLTSITIPSGVETVGECAFSGCTGLKEFITLQPNWI